MSRPPLQPSSLQHEIQAHPQERRCTLQPRLEEPRPALFLDRDGVIIEDAHHLCDPDGVKLCQGARALIRQASASGWPVVVITNQSGIARGLFGWREYALVTARMVELLGPEAPLAAIYANGHGPDAPSRSWRKPSAAMLLDAAEGLNLDLAASLLIGDRLSDLMAGEAAGLSRLCHVLSGHGQSERSAVQLWHRNLPATRSPELLLLPGLEAFPPDGLSPRLTPLP